uniref:Putative secreted peptide n=1 Tax=Anopheles braziliensis TaxID=58242 RepID=A0A2M3ZWX4_9DIPT
MALRSWLTVAAATTSDLSAERNGKLIIVPLSLSLWLDQYLHFYHRNNRRGVGNSWPVVQLIVAIEFRPKRASSEREVVCSTEEAPDNNRVRFDCRCCSQRHGRLSGS